MKIKKFLSDFKYILLIALIVFNTIFIYTVSSQVSRIKENNNRIEKIADDFAALQDDVFLGEEVELASQPTLSQSLQVELDKYLNQQATEANNTKVVEFFDSIIDQELPEGFTLRKLDPNTYQIRDSVSPVGTIIKDENLNLSINTLNQNQKLNPFELETFKSSVQEVFQTQNLQNLATLNQSYQTFLNTHSIISQPANQAIINGKSLELLSPYYENSKAKADLTKEGQLMLTIQLNLSTNQYSLLDFSQKNILTQSDETTFIEQILTHIQDNEFQTLFEQNIVQKIDLITSELSKDSIQQTLNQNQLTISDPIDNNQSWSISILNQSNQSILTIRIDKQTSRVFIDTETDSIQLNFKDLNFKLDEASKDSENFLILGKHGSMTDTIIIANFNQKTEEVKLISIPRDLYLEDKKINSIYSYRGLQALISEVEQITGLRIEKHALIDMYTFVDVVDYLGGIEVTLTRPLVDFNYKTFDDGQWGTLNLQPGKHKLNGRQALRVARSRYSTSDFDRSYRQHLILNAIQERIKQLGAKDIKAISQIGLLGLQSTETDLSLTESLKYFTKYKDYTVTETVVLSPANVLESTYTGLLNGKDPNTLQEATNRGAYILLPKNDDWSLIRTFVFNFLR